MALIKCPECNGQVSDKADVCIHCGYPLKEIKCNGDVKTDKSCYIYDYVNLDEKKQSKYLNRDCWILVVNDVDNNLKENLYIELYDENKILLGTARVNLVQKNESLAKIYIWKIDNVSFEKLSQIKIIDKDVINKREEQIRRANSINYSVLNQVKCPKCGSTQIQMVPRKWSLLTGFLTNKVDRVCMNCKCKF